MAGFYEELKRRNVVRVGIAYVVTAWLILQVADLVMNNVPAPAWVMQLLLVVAAAGFPIALIFAWAFEVTPEGIKRESEVDRSQPAARKSGRKIDRIIIAVVVTIFVLLVANRVFQVDVPGPDQLANTSVPVEKTIGVLAFADLSENQDQQWFADGLAEEILNALTRTPDLLVSSRTSSFAYKNTTKNVQTIADELGVAHILEGSVRRVGDRLRITAQLIRASDGFHLWSQNYDRDAADVIEIQEDLALQIANALETTMDPAALADMVLVGTRSVEAYQEYIRGVAMSMQALGEFGKEQIVDAYENFERARSIDPGFFEAHRQAAMFWLYQLTPADARRGLTDSTPPQMLDEFTSRINLAIESAANDIDRTVMRALKAQVELRLRDAIGLYKTYLESRPHDREAWQRLLRTAMFASDRETVLAVLDHYLSIADSDMSAAIWYMGNAYKYVDPSQTADIGLAALERWPNSRALIYQTHRSLLWAMRVDEAAKLALQYKPRSESDRAVETRQACAEGRRDDVLQIMEERRAAGLGLDAVDIFLARFLGDDERATNILRQYESDEVPYRLATWLHYHIFDPTPFPSLIKVLERENIERPPPAEIPFACPPE
jgi:TolB-like protein